VKRKRQIFTAFALGLLFALGLGISGMTQPKKVIGFLDIFGDWDPSLMFVMVGAILVHALSFLWIRRRPSPLLSTEFHLPKKREITPALVIGASMFGVGWGLAGYCPGPAITSLASLQRGPVLFVLAMLAGMIIYHFFEKKFSPRK
jgi:uncharacterized membrane protein YedE/YeeE